MDSHMIIDSSVDRNSNQNAASTQLKNKSPMFKQRAKRTMSYFPTKEQAMKLQSTLLGFNSLLSKDSAEARLTSFKINDTTKENLAKLPEKLRVQREGIIDKSKPLQTRFQLALQMVLQNSPSPINKQFEFTPLQKKLSTPAIIGDFDSARVKILLEFLFCFSEQYVFPSKERLLDTTVPANQRPEILRMLQIIVALCHICTLDSISKFLVKLKSEYEGRSKVKETQESLVLQGQALANHITLTADLFGMIAHDQTDQMRKDVIDVVVNWTKWSVDELLRHSRETLLTRQSRFAGQDNRGSITEQARLGDIQLELVEVLVFSQLTVFASLQDPVKKLSTPLDEDVQLKIFNSLVTIVQMSIILETFFFSPVVHIDMRHFHPGSCPVFKHFLLDVHSGTYYNESSLLNLVVQVTLSSCEKVKRIANTLPLVKETALYKDEDRLVPLLDKIVGKQIQYYLKTEQLQPKPTIDCENVDQNCSPKVFDCLAERCAKNIEVSIASEDVDKNCGNDPDVKYSSSEVLSDSMIATKVNECCLFGEDLAYNSLYQVNWLRVNFILFRLAKLLLAKFYMRGKASEKQGDNSGLNLNRMATLKLEFYDVRKPTGFLTHLCDLFRIQIFFVLRFNYFGDFNHALSKNIKTLEDITIFESYNCMLCLTFQAFFGLISDQEKHCNFNIALMRQIFLLLRLIKRGVYNIVDSRHFLKVYFLVFLEYKICPITYDLNFLCSNDKKDGQNDSFGQFTDQSITEKKQIFEDLITLFSLSFYSDKYVRLFEDCFDLEQIQHLAYLQDILFNCLKAKIPDEEKCQEEEVKLLNLAVVQQTALRIVGAYAKRDSDVFLLCFQYLQDEIKKDNFRQYLKEMQYTETTTVFEVPESKVQFTTTEFLSPNIGPFTSQLYMLLKLTVVILNTDSNEDDFSSVVYHVLVNSEDHYNSRHLNKSGTRFQPYASDIRCSQQPIGLQLESCNDCLAQQFSPFNTRQGFLREEKSKEAFSSLIMLFLHYFQQLSTPLYTSKQQKMSWLFQSTKRDTGSKMIQRKHETQEKFFKQSQKEGLTHKIASLIKRFMVYAVQNYKIADIFLQRVLESVTKPDGNAGNQKAFAECKDLEFKLLMLRNLVFQLDLSRQLPGALLQDSKEATWIFEQLNATLHGIYKGIQQFNKATKVEPEIDLLGEAPGLNSQAVKDAHETQSDFTLTVHPVPVTVNLMTASQLFVSPQISSDCLSSDMSTEKVFNLYKKRFIDDRKAEHRRLCEEALSLLSLYIHVVCKNAKSLELLANKQFHQHVLDLLYRPIIEEGSLGSSLVQEALNAYTFSLEETVLPESFISTQKKLEPDGQDIPAGSPSTRRDITGHQLLGTNTASYYYRGNLNFVFHCMLEFIKTAQTDSNNLPQVNQCLQKMVETLHSRCVGSESMTSDLLKLGISLMLPAIVEQVKKILIFLHEQISYSGHETQERDMRNTTKLMMQVIVRVFSVVPNGAVIRDFFSFIREVFFYNKMMDSVDLGLALNVLKMMNDILRSKSEQLSSALTLKKSTASAQLVDYFYFSKETPGLLVLDKFKIDSNPFICVLFKIQADKIAAELPPKQNGPVIKNLMSFVMQTGKDENIGKDYHNYPSFDLNVAVDLTNQTFFLLDGTDLNVSASNTISEPRKLKNRWYYLLVRFKKRSGVLSNSMRVEVHVDKLESEPQLVVNLPNFDIKGTYMMSMGNTVKHLLANHIGERPKKLETVFTRPIKSLQKTSDQRQLFFTGKMSLPLFFKNVDNFKDLLQNSDIANGFMDGLVEMLNSKDMIDHTSLDISPHVYRYLEFRYELCQPEKDAKKPKKQQHIVNYVDLNEFTKSVILLHSQASQNRFLFAVHSRRSSDVIVSLGGMKLLYPVIESVVKSNLSDLGLTTPGLVLKWLFTLLNSYVLCEPLHIQKLSESRNLVQNLRYALLRIGKHRMISQELISEVKNVVRKNPLVCRIQDNKGATEGSGFTEIDPASLKHHTHILSFLVAFTQQIIFDPFLAVQTCIDATHANPAHDSESGVPSATMVVYQMVDMIYSICCATSKSQRNFTVMQVQRIEKSNQKDSDSQNTSNRQQQGILNTMQTDWNFLKYLVVRKETVWQLLEMIHQVTTSQCWVDPVLVQKLGECVATCIVQLDDASSFKDILNRVQKQTLPVEQLRIFTYIVLKVIREEENLKKSKALLAIYKTEFKTALYAKLLIQNDQPEEKGGQVTDEMEKKDQITALVLLTIVQHFMNEKTKYWTMPFVERPSYTDGEKEQLLKHITSNLAKNSYISLYTYLTLMLIAMSKRRAFFMKGDLVPNVDDVTKAIQEANVSRETVSDGRLFQLLDFDIDFFFLTLEHFKMYSDLGKKLFFNQFLSFLRYHQRGFMREFHINLKEGKGLYSRRIRTFFYQIVGQVFENPDDTLMASLAQNVIVEVCVFLFMENHEDKKDASIKRSDEWGIQLFQRIFLFFSRDQNKSLELLLKILKTIYLQIDTPEIKFAPVRIKLCLKLMVLLQFVEEIYTKYSQTVAENELFVETVAVLLFLFEQLKIMRFDLPDSAFYDQFEAADDSYMTTQSYTKLTATSDKSAPFVRDKKGLQNISNLGLPLNSVALARNKNFMPPTDDASTKGAMAISMPNFNPTPGNVSARIPQAAMASSDFNRADSHPTQDQIHRRSLIFLGGGPLRIFLHLILRALAVVELSTEVFQRYQFLLRFVLLNETSSFMHEALTKHIGEKLPARMQQQAAQTFKNAYSLGKRPFMPITFEEKGHGTLSRQNSSNNVPNKPSKQPSVRNLLQNDPKSAAKSTHERATQAISQPVPEKLLVPGEESGRHYQKHELNLGISILFAMKTYAKECCDRHQESDQASNIQNLPAQKFKDIACYNRQVSKQINFPPGFSMVKGLVSTAMIAELFQIIQLIYDDDSDKNFFPSSNSPMFEQQSSSSEYSQFSQKSELSYSQIAKIELLLQLLFDSLTEQLNLREQRDKAGVLFINMLSPKLKEKMLQVLRKLQTEDFDRIKGQLTYFCQARSIEEPVNVQEQLFQRQTPFSPDREAELKIEKKPSNTEPATQVIGNMTTSTIIHDHFKSPTRRKQESQKKLIKTNSKESEELKLNTSILSSIKSPNKIPDGKKLLTYSDLSNPSSESIHIKIGEGFTGYMDIDVTDRKSWINSIEPVAYNQHEEKLPTFGGSTSNAEQELKNQLEQQIVNFVTKLYLALAQFHESRDEEKRRHLSQILLQTICKRKVQLLLSAFTIVTSDRFVADFEQAKSNSDKVMMLISTEIQALTGKRLQDLVETPKAKPSHQQNHLLASQRFEQPSPFENSPISIKRVSHGPGGSIRPKQDEDFIPNFGLALVSKDSSSTLSKHLPPESLQGATSAPTTSPHMQLHTQPAEKRETKYTFAYLFAKSKYKHFLKRLQEDSSSIWYDHLEQAVRDFTDVKEIYMQTFQQDSRQFETYEQWLKKYVDKLHRGKDTPAGLEKWKQYKNARELYGNNVLANAEMGQTFIRQRRKVDRWNRMMLVKPNRDYFKTKGWRYFDYFIFDFLNKVFAVSLLEDQDFPDFTNKLHERKQDIDETENTQENAFSARLMAIRNKVLEKLERNRFLQRVFCDPEAFDLIQKDLDPAVMKILEPEGDRKHNPVQLAKTRQFKTQALLANEEKNKISSQDNSFIAQMITTGGAMWGDIIITKEYFAFLSFGIIPEEAKEFKYIEGSDLIQDRKEIILKWAEVEEVFFTKFYNVFQAFELYSVEKKVRTFNLCSEENLDRFYIQLQMLKKQQGEQFELVKDRKNAFQKKAYINDWMEGQISNQELLLAINKFSCRSLNDMSQYPIFPWVLSDYSSSVAEFRVNFAANKCFRDLAKNTASLSDDKKRNPEEKYNDMKQEDAEERDQDMYGREPFQLRYGCSSKMAILGRLIRLEPFTGSFQSITEKDDPNRVMYSLDASFKGVNNHEQQNMELFPEFFYMPEMFSNPNNINLGVNTHNKQLVDQFFLPPYAMNNHDLVRIQREALESKHVTENLWQWIDQLFGVDQKNPAKFNIYFSYTYEETHKQKDALAHFDNRMLSDFMIVPSKLFDESLNPQLKKRVEATSVDLQRNPTLGERPQLERGLLPGQPIREQVVNNLIQYFTENKPEQMSLHRVADNQKLDQQHNIVHMLFTNLKKKCFVFIRQEDDVKAPKNEQLNLFARQKRRGNLVVYLTQSQITKQQFSTAPCNLEIRYEHISEDLNNVFQEFTDSCQENAKYLYACGYLDNSVRIFDLNEKKKGKSHLVHTLREHSARVTCIKFTKDYAYFISCDADGIIRHYQRNCHFTDSVVMPSQAQTEQTKVDRHNNPFPFTLLYVLQDQMEEIVSIDTNSTLDMYVTVSKDGTVALRCLRTSKLWHLFKLCIPKEIKGQQKPMYGFSKIFRHVAYVKLSLHGYIVVIGRTTTQNLVRYLVFSLNGDLLQNVLEECDLVNVFLSNKEDSLIICYNKIKLGTIQGQIKVSKLYGLQKTADLGDICYKETIRAVQKHVLKHFQEQDWQSGYENDEAEISPSIEAIAISKLERNINIFYVRRERIVAGGLSKETKEVVSFDAAIFAVWKQLTEFAMC